MTDVEIQILVDQAFTNVPRPTIYCSCSCVECQEIISVLMLRDNDTIKASDLDYSTALISPEAFWYFTPGLVRLSLCDDKEEDVNSISESYIFSDLCLPVSKKAPPRCHPKATQFDRMQTVAVYAFLDHVSKSWFDSDEELPREIKRGLENWEYFVDAFDHG